jgi:hypothetical protein
MPETKPKRRWLQFSLRTCLLILLIAGVVFGLVANHAHKRKSAIALIRTNGGTIRFGPETDPAWYEKLLRRFFGAETYQPVRHVNMLTGGFIKREKKKLPEDFLARISALPEIVSLGLENTVIAEADWRNIARFRKLEQVLLSHSNVSDDGVKYLAQLPELEGVSMKSTTEITDAAIPYISKLPKLTDLKLGSTNITDQGLRALSPDLKLEILELQSVKVTSHGVEALKNIPSLRIVALSRTDVDDRVLDVLGGLPNIQVLQLVRTHVTAEGVQRFREVHPQCNVTGP